MGVAHSIWELHTCTVMNSCLGYQGATELIFANTDMQADFIHC